MRKRIHKKWWGLLLGLSLLLCAGTAAAAAPKSTKPVAFAKKSIVLQAGDALRLKPVTARPLSSLKWTSSKPSVVHVSRSGKIKAKQPGTAKITVKAGRYKAACRVTVVRASLNEQKVTIHSGEKVKLKVKGLSGGVKWSSSNPAVAYVNQKGRVLGRKKGSAVIKASFGESALTCTVRVKYTAWDKALAKYEKNPKVNQLLFVQYTGGSSADVLFYRKTGGKWKLELQCGGYVGYNGIDKVREGDGKTPTGTFTLTQGFGIKKDPGSVLPYVKVTPYLYWCGDPQYYNQLIDIREKPHNCTGEHLIDYTTSYDYGMFLDYNPQNVYKKGCAIFLHCFGGSPRTAGCIAVSKENMIYLLRNVEQGAKICIYPK